MSLNNTRKVYILLLGDKSVGKTSLVHRYINEEYSRHLKATILTDDLVSLQSWDTSESDRFMSIGMEFYKSVDCCIFVFDVTCRKSFGSLNIWRDEFFLRSEKNPKEFPVAIVGTKIDLENDRKVSKQEAQDWCNSFSIPYFECSSKDDINVQQVFEAMMAKLEDTHAKNYTNYFFGACGRMGKQKRSNKVQGMIAKRVMHKMRYF